MYCTKNHLPPTHPNLLHQKIVEIWQTFLSNSTLQTGIFYKNVTDKVFEVLEELGIWLCHNGGNETFWFARRGFKLFKKFLITQMR